MDEKVQGAQAPKTEQHEAPKGRPCPQDCSKCGPWQQMFCCTKMIFDLSKNLQIARQEVAQLRAEIAELKKNMPNQAMELSSPPLGNTAQ